MLELDAVASVIPWCLAAAYYVVLIGAAAGVFWLGKKRRRSLAALLGIACAVLLIPGFLLYLLPGSRAVNDLIESRRLTGTSFLLGSPVLKYESEVHFNGDGYVIYVFEISTATARSFQNPAIAFLNEYPRRPWYRHDWKSRTWTRTPLAPGDMENIELAFDAEGADPQCQRAVELAQKLVAEPGNYVSYFFKPGMNIDLFILSPKRMRLVLINHNT